MIQNWQIACRDVSHRALDPKELRQLACYLESDPKITEKYRKKVLNCIKRTHEAASPTIAITLLRELMVFLEHRSTQPLATTTIRKVNGDKRFYMMANVEVKIAEFFFVLVKEPFENAISILEKYRENSSEAKTIKFKTSKQHQSDASKRSKRRPDQDMIEVAEKILKDHPPEKPKSYQGLADYLKKKSAGLKFSEFKKSWVFKHKQRFKDHIKK